jgi:hypothetical protein
MLTYPHTWWQEKQSRWLHERIAAGAHTLGKRSVFILPTRQGFYLGFFLLAMLIACINYNLSLGYMLTFFVFSVALGAMHRTHQNLLGLRIEPLAVIPVFAGQAISLPLRIDNPTRLSKFAIHLTQRGHLQGVHARVASKGVETVALSLIGIPRGIHGVPAIEVSSIYPLGLWRAWSYVFPEGEMTVYPEPHSPLPTLLTLPQDKDKANALSAIQAYATRDAQGDAISHIESTDTASTRNIHWPALAKGQLAQHIRENNTPTTQAVLLSLAGCTVQGIEAQLSQLCFAIQHCEALSVPFALQLDRQVFPATGVPAMNAQHVQQCLLALAAYE